MDLQLFSQEKTEEATPRKRQEARKKGQVFKSVELVSGLTLLGSYLTLRLAGGYMAGHLFTFSRTLWEEGATQDWSEAGVRNLINHLFLGAAVTVLPVVLGVALVGVASNLIQVGLITSTEPLVPNFDRINPLSGLKRLLSRRTLAEMAKAILKLSMIGYVAYSAISGQVEALPSLLALPPPQVALFIANLVSSLLLRVGIAVLVLGVVDYFYQRYEFEQSLRMTKQEVKEELKQTDGNPEIRSKIRQKQRELSRGRMMEDVRKADVVVTNPTTFAVAIAYQQGRMSAPKVLAKGRGIVALRIREVATEHRVPIVENKPLARELYRLVAVGQEVPAELYQAVAEVLAFVYQLKERSF